MSAHPRVGVGVVIRREGKVLMGLRTGKHAHNTWGYPGGHLEQGESWEECARREVAEECGLGISTPQFGFVTNDIFPDGKHYITLIMVADYLSGEPQALEPDKTIDWQWVEWNSAPQPLMLTIENAKRAGFNPFAPALPKAA